MEKRILIAAFVLLGGARLVSGDVVTLTGNAAFPNIAVESVGVAAGGVTLLARELQNGMPVGEPRPLESSAVRRIEFRAVGDGDVRPRGRAAAMVMTSGNRFDTVWVESCEGVPSGGFVFNVRESHVSPGGAFFPVQSMQILSLTFRPYGLSAPPPPAAGAAGAMAPPIKAPSGVAPTVMTGSVAIPGVPGNPPVSSGPGMASGPAAPAAPGVGAIAVTAAPASAPAAAGLPASSVVSAENSSPGETAQAALPADLTIRAPGEVTEKDLKTRVTVVGQIIAIRPSWSTRAPNIVTLGKDDKRIDFVYWDDVHKALGDRMEAFDTVGSMVKVSGDVEDYRGNVQLRVTSPEDLQLADHQPAPTPPETRSPSQILETDAGKRFIVQGTVGKIEPSSQDNVPSRVEVTDPQGGKIVVVFWRDPQGITVGSHPPEVGKAWEVEGKVQVHRGEVQLRAKSANDGK